MKKEITLKVKPGQWGELAKVAEDIRTMEKECWQGRTMRNPPFAEEKPLYAENLRKAGIRSGCFAYLFAALIVCALLAAIPLLMVFLGWLTGGAK